MKYIKIFLIFLLLLLNDTSLAADIYNPSGGYSSSRTIRSQKTIPIWTLTKSSEYQVGGSKILLPYRLDSFEHYASSGKKFKLYQFDPNYNNWETMNFNEGSTTNQKLNIPIWNITMYSDATIIESPIHIMNKKKKAMLLAKGNIDPKRFGCHGEKVYTKKFEALVGRTRKFMKKIKNSTKKTISSVDDFNPLKVSCTQSKCYYIDIDTDLPNVARIYESGTEETLLYDPNKDEINGTLIDFKVSRHRAIVLYKKNNGKYYAKEFTEIVCPNGYHYNSERNRCEAEPKCDSDYELIHGIICINKKNSKISKYKNMSLNKLLNIAPQLTKNISSGIRPPKCPPAGINTVNFDKSNKVCYTDQEKICPSGTTPDPNSHKCIKNAKIIKTEYRPSCEKGYTLFDSYKSCSPYTFDQNFGTHWGPNIIYKADALCSYKCVKIKSWAIGRTKHNRYKCIPNKHTYACLKPSIKFSYAIKKKPKYYHGHHNTIQITDSLLSFPTSFKLNNAYCFQKDDKIHKEHISVSVKYCPARSRNRCTYRSETELRFVKYYNCYSCQNHTDTLDSLRELCYHTPRKKEKINKYSCDGNAMFDQNRKLCLYDPIPQASSLNLYKTPKAEIQLPAPAISVAVNDKLDVFLLAQASEHGNSKIFIDRSKQIMNLNFRVKKMCSTKDKIFFISDLGNLYLSDIKKSTITQPEEILFDQNLIDISCAKSIDQLIMLSRNGNVYIYKNKSISKINPPINNNEIPIKVFAATNSDEKVLYYVETMTKN